MNRRTKQPIIPFLVLCLVLAASTQCFGESFCLRGYKIGDVLPAFTAYSISSKKQLTFNPRGNSPALIVFFSITPAFRQERSLAMIDKIQELIDKEFAGKVRTALVFSDSRKKAAIKNMIADGLIPPPVYDDSNKAIYNKFGVFITPLVILCNANGSLHEVVPPTHNIKQLLRNNLKLLLGEWNKEEFKKSFKPKYTKKWTKEEKAYLRHINYGKIMYSRKMYPSAIREFTIAAKIIADGYEAQLGLGQAYMQTMKYNKAIMGFDRALQINSDSTTALAGLGVTYFRMGENAKAVKILENALITEEPNIEAIIALARIYEEMGDIEKAMRLNKLAVLKLQRQVE